MTIQSEYLSRPTARYSTADALVLPSDCVGGIIGVSSEYGLPANLAIVGDVFLKSWYVTFDYAGSRLGLAPSINNH